jgi:signal peptidase I
MTTLLKRRTTRQLLELVAVVGSALLLALLVQRFVVKPYKIPTGSMEPTLMPNQRVLVDRLGHELGGPPALGAIVVFHPPIGADSGVCGASHPPGSACDVHAPREASEYFIKRVVGLPGDLISIHNGVVIRNGRPERAPYARACDDPSLCEFPVAIRIPPGEYFMMGDNRPDSEDSRFWGPVPNSWIVGDAVATYWPPDRIGTL